MITLVCHVFQQSLEFWLCLSHGQSSRTRSSSAVVQGDGSHLGFRHRNGEATTAVDRPVLLRESQVTKVRFTMQRILMVKDIFGQSDEPLRPIDKSCWCWLQIRDGVIELLTHQPASTHLLLAYDILGKRRSRTSP